MSMEKVPQVPAVPACATKVAGESTSAMVNIPLVDSGASVSVRVTVWADSTAASLVPMRWTVIVVVVPSAALTGKVSV
jgi:hypothetical protein